MTDKHDKSTVLEQINRAKKELDDRDMKFISHELNLKRNALAIKDIIQLDVIPILPDKKSFYTSKMVRKSSIRPTNHQAISRKLSYSMISPITSSNPNITLYNRVLTENILKNTHFMNNKDVWKNLIENIRHYATDIIRAKKPVNSNDDIIRIWKNLTNFSYLTKLPKSVKMLAAMDLIDRITKPATPPLSNQSENTISTCFDPSRIYFKAGILFESMNLYERSIYSYEQAVLSSHTILIDESNDKIRQIIESYDIIVQASQYNRKIERSSKLHIQRMLDNHSRKVTSSIGMEVERQCRIYIVSLVRLLRIYLSRNQIKESHQTILKIFHYIDEMSLRMGLSKKETMDKENLEVLVLCHHLLRDYAISKPSEWSDQEKILKSSSGPLAELHIHILHRLHDIKTNSELMDDVERHDIMEWLGRRYAEKCDFIKSMSYYKMIRDQDCEENRLSSDVLLNRYIGRPLEPSPIYVSTSSILSSLPEINSTTSTRRMSHNLLNTTFIPYDHIKTMETMENTRNKGWNDRKSFMESQLDLALSKVPMRIHDWDSEMNVDTRQASVSKTKNKSISNNSNTATTESLDYTGFMGSHKDSHTIIYKPPAQGWDQSCHAESNRLSYLHTTQR